MMAGAAALGMVACGGEDTTTGATGPFMEVALTVTPNPITAAASDDAEFEWMATYTVTLTESGGLGGTISAVGAALNEASGGIEVITDGELTRSTANGPSDRLEAGGTAELSFVTYYTLPGGGREALIDVTVQVQDDDGFVGQVGARVSVS
jgi:hypothetical protein